MHHEVNPNIWKAFHQVIWYHNLEFKYLQISPSSLDQSKYICQPLLDMAEEIYLQNNSPVKENKSLTIGEVGLVGLEVLETR